MSVARYVWLPVFFENGVLKNAFEDYAVHWLNAIRGTESAPFETGKVTYYKLFGNTWCTDNFEDSGKAQRIPLGEGEVTYRYNPYDPAAYDCLTFKTKEQEYI